MMNSINHFINDKTSRIKLDKKQIIIAQHMNNSKTINRERNKLEAFYEKPKISSPTSTFDKIISTRHMNHFETIAREKNKLEAFYAKPKISSTTTFSKLIYEKAAVQNNSEFDINDVHKRNIRTIYNVYQPFYRDGVKVTGFGDFIRGCYFALDFCERFNIQFEIILNHPISSFLNVPSKRHIVQFENVKMFINNNCYAHSVDKNNVIHNITGTKINSEFISYLSKDASVHDDYALIYNLVYPQHEISEVHKEYMQRFLCPNAAMEQSICDTMTSLDITRLAYSVIHIRSGDNFSNTMFQPEYINQLCKYINKIIYTDIKIHNNYLLISDNNEIKSIMIDRFPALKVLNNQITHVATAFANKDEMVKNTMIDFYLMSRSKAIHSFSCYDHGSGFSQWCAKTYNIPFTCRLVKP
jgi:hypothetical protein